MTNSTRRRAVDVAMLAATLTGSVALTWAWGALGDYPTDGGPPISDFLHGRLGSFFHHQPSMGSLALFARLPFAALGLLGSPTPRNLYLYGAAPCVASVGLLGWWLARIARSRGTGTVGQLAILAVCLVNPLVQSALELGHPEELLTASLSVGALVAAARRRQVAAAILLGLALATKQWSVVVILPVLLLAINRRRTLLLALALAAGASAPLFAGSPWSFLHTQIGLVHQHYLEPAAESWLYPLAPSVARHIALDGHAVTVSVARLPAGLVGLLHPLIVALAAGLAAALWRRTRGRPSPEQVFALVALTFLLRCTLDTETMPYYHAGLLLTLVAWDALSGARLPTRALAAAGIAYVMADLLLGGVPRASAFYLVVTGLGAALLAAELTRRRARSPGRRTLVPGHRRRPQARAGGGAAAGIG